MLNRVRTLFLSILFVALHFQTSLAANNKTNTTGGKSADRLGAQKEAEVLAFPFVVVFIGKDGVYRGQGAIIGPYTILTDGLFHGVEVPDNDFLVIAGRHKTFEFSPTEQAREVCNSVVHKDFDKGLINSYQLIFLTDPFIFNDYVKAIIPKPDPVTLPDTWPSLPCVLLSRGPKYDGDTALAHLYRTEVVAYKADDEEHPCPLRNHSSILCGSSANCAHDDGGLLVCFYRTMSHLYGIHTMRIETDCDHSYYANMENLPRSWLVAMQAKEKSLPVCMNTSFLDDSTRGGLRVKESRVYAGTESPRHFYPFLVVFKFSVDLSVREFPCHGFLLNPYTVMTSGTCFIRLEAVNKKDIRVVAGAHDLSVREKDVQTRAICDMEPYNEQYQLEPTINSWALIHLNDPFRGTDQVGFLNLPPEELLNEPELGECNFAGWGEQNRTDGFQALRHTNATVQRDCIKPTFNHSTHMCTWTVICSGDEGAPLVCTSNNREFAYAVAVEFDYCDDEDCKLEKESLFASLETLNRTWVQDSMKRACETCRPPDIKPADMP